MIQKSRNIKIKWKLQVTLCHIDRILMYGMCTLQLVVQLSGLDAVNDDLQGDIHALQLFQHIEHPLVEVEKLKKHYTRY